MKLATIRRDVFRSCTGISVLCSNEDTTETENEPPWHTYLGNVFFVHECSLNILGKFTFAGKSMMGVAEDQ